MIASITKKVICDGVVYGNKSVIIWEIMGRNAGRLTGAVGGADTYDGRRSAKTSAFEGETIMETCEYMVVQIDGDYARLRRTDATDMAAELKLVARALLPEDIMEGSRLRYEFLQYELIN